MEISERHGKGEMDDGEQSKCDGKRNPWQRRAAAEAVTRFRDREAHVALPQE